MVKKSSRLSLHEYLPNSYFELDKFAETSLEGEENSANHQESNN